MTSVDFCYYFLEGKFFMGIGIEYSSFLDSASGSKGLDKNMFKYLLVNCRYFNTHIHISALVFTDSSAVVANLLY